MIKLNKNDWTAKEVSRVRIPAPGADDTYCEKNWMPILDRQFEMVKWTSPTEVVHVGETCKTLITTDAYSVPWDLRGGSQVVPWDGMYIAILHEVNLYNNYRGQKDGVYRHKLVVWDNKFNLIGVSPEPFAFFGARIEFCAGMAYYNNNFLITFGYQDNAAFILQLPEELMSKMVDEAVGHVE